MIVNTGHSSRKLNNNRNSSSLIDKADSSSGVQRKYPIGVRHIVGDHGITDIQGEISLDGRACSRFQTVSNPIRCSDRACICCIFGQTGDIVIW